MIHLGSSPNTVVEIYRDHKVLGRSAIMLDTPGIYINAQDPGIYKEKELYLFVDLKQMERQKYNLFPQKTIRFQRRKLQA